ncbi:MAG TPA: DUF4349 domain-containing protein [Planctomycetota bacterium]
MRILTTAIVFLLLASCGPDGTPTTTAESVSPARAGGSGPNSGGFILPPPAPEPGDASDAAQDANRKIVRTGELELGVPDLDAARSSVLEATKAAGGHVADDRVQQSGRFVQRTLRLRVPAAGFETLVAMVERLGRVERLQVSADDVTAQWVDVEARMRAKRQMEGRYLELVTRAANVAEVLQVERELGAVRAEIEAMESQLRSLGDQVALSTLKVTLSAPRTQPVIAPTVDFTQALGAGWTALMQCLFLVLTAWPLLAIGAFALVYRRVRRPRTPPLPAAA